MSLADKETYKDLEAKDRIRYNEEVKTLGGCAYRPRKGASKKKNDVPKRPMSKHLIENCKGKRHFARKRGNARCNEFQFTDIIDSISEVKNDFHRA